MASEAIKVKPLAVENISNISPISDDYIIIRWLYIEQDNSNPFYSGCMKNFDIEELILLDRMNPRKVNVDSYTHIKLSHRDVFMFGFLLNLGFRLYFKCISDEFIGKDKKNTKLDT